MDPKAASAFVWADSVEGRVCLRANAMLRFVWLKHFLRVMSRLGNGLLWYCVLGAIPLVAGRAGLAMTTHIGLTALVGVGIYKLCKRFLLRERPFVTHQSIACVGTPLDRGSFPSGHTIHAACFTTMLAAYEPASLAVFLPVALSIAISRIALGHHYPSDVAAGGIIGVGLAMSSLQLAGL
ncbi:MAG: phosphatase PAP2 family protein [Gammaproteobacteria bacterium]|jgi:undecaprenyl-diphosphatase|nr:phosphatase PAP2 family protein [Gammaproteobacteria bacterium]